MVYTPSSLSYFFLVSYLLGIQHNRRNQEMKLALTKKHSHPALTYCHTRFFQCTLAYKWKLSKYNLHFQLYLQWLVHFPFSV